jgi:PTS system mannose-specific IIC component
MCERALERYSERLAERALVSAESGDLSRAIRQNLWGMWPHFVVFGLFTAACAQAGYSVAPTWEQVPFYVARGLAWAYPAMASVAAAVAARGSHSRRAAFYASASAGAVILAGAVRSFLEVAK